MFARYLPDDGPSPGGAARSPENEGRARVLKELKDFYGTSRSDSVFWAVKAATVAIFLARLVFFQRESIAAMIMRGDRSDVANLFAYLVILASLVALRRIGAVFLLMVQSFQFYGAWSHVAQTGAGAEALAVNMIVDEFMFTIAALAVMVGAYQYYTDERVI